MKQTTFDRLMVALSSSPYEKKHVLLSCGRNGPLFRVSLLKHRDSLNTRQDTLEITGVFVDSELRKLPPEVYVKVLYVTQHGRLKKRKIQAYWNYKYHEVHIHIPEGRTVGVSLSLW